MADAALQYDDYLEEQPINGVTSSRISNVSKSYQDVPSTTMTKKKSASVNVSPRSIQKQYQTKIVNNAQLKKPRTNDDEESHARINNQNGGGTSVQTARRTNNIVARRQALLVGDFENDTKIIKAKAKSRAFALVIVGWMVSLFVTVFNFLFIYFFNAYNEVKDGGVGAVWNITKSAVESAATLDSGAAAETAAMVGFYFNSDTLMGWMVISWFLGAIIAAAFLFLATDMMSRTGAKTSNATVKSGLFLTALVAAFIPIANVWPWTNTLLRHIGKHPE